MTDKNTSADVIKVDAELGIVFGWAIICKQDDQPYFDLHGDHIPEDAMMEAVVDFAKSVRVMGDMHQWEDGEPVKHGQIAFLMPLTTDVAAAFGILTETTGLMIGAIPDDPAVLEKYKSGEYTGFSMGGWRVEDEEVDI